PKDFKNTFEVFEPRPGGAWKFVMHGPDGTDYKNESVFRELEKPSRIVLDHLSSPRFRVVATFAAEADKTRFTFRMIFETAEMHDRVKGIVVNANEENFDRLAVQLRRLHR
ncbi:MAG: SRPBCC domain-containing protein, partial [Rariglobus sp.]|nr:SRPBCC domain-containing protein [Rariglobus sp.]